MDEEILIYPDERLTKPSAPIDRFDEKFDDAVERMKKTILLKRGVGLAAIQIGIPLRLILLRNPDKREMPKVYTNPVVVATEGEVTDDEGCLSFPGFWLKLPAPQKVTLKAQDEKGREFTRTFTDYMARAVMHEMDHLDGKLLIDRLPEDERAKARTDFLTMINDIPA